MGTLSENQTQEHNTEENRPGREDLGRPRSRCRKRGELERLRAPLRGRKGLWTCYVAVARVLASEPPGPSRPLLCRAGVRSRSSFLPLLRRSRPPARGSQRAVSLLICELGVWVWFGFLLLLCLPLSLSPPPPKPGSSAGTSAAAQEWWESSESPEMTDE